MSQRIIVITGAARGLGAACAVALAAQGDKVVVTARSQAKADAAAKALREQGHAGVAMAVDVSSDASVAAFASRVRDEVGQVDVLINNAGAIFESQQSDVFNTSAELMLRAFDNNALGAYRMTQALLQGMNSRGYGRVVNVSSGMGALTDMDGGFPAYRVSKAALNAITCAFAVHAGSGVKVNAVCPGWVRTDMGGAGATRSIDEGIRGILWAANLPEDGPSGGFFRDGVAIPW